MKFLSSFTKNPEKRRVYGLLVLSSVLLLVLGYLLKHLGVHELFVHFVNEIGIAGLVGFFLAITIEDLSQAEFHKIAKSEREEIKKDVFFYVYGYEIPLSIRDEINAHILKVPYVRRKVEMKYELEPTQVSDTNEWYVLATLTMSYYLENLTIEDVTFPFSAAIDKSPSPQLEDHVRFIELSVTGCKEPFAWDEAALKNKQTDEGHEPAGIVSVPVSTSAACTKSSGTGPKRSADDAGRLSASSNLTHVRFKTETVRVFPRGHIDFIFTSHICDLDLMVLADRRLKVYPSTSELNPLERQTELPPTLSWVYGAVSDTRELYYWTLKKPLLAYQSLQIFWGPQDTEFDKATAKVARETEPRKS